MLCSMHAGLGTDQNPASFIMLPFFLPGVQGMGTPGWWHPWRPAAARVG